MQTSLKQVLQKYDSSVKEEGGKHPKMIFWGLFWYQVGKD